MWRWWIESRVQNIPQALNLFCRIVRCFVVSRSLLLFLLASPSSLFVTNFFGDRISKSSQFSWKKFDRVPIIGSCESSTFLDASNILICAFRLSSPMSLCLSLFSPPLLFALLVSWAGGTKWDQVRSFWRPLGLPCLRRFAVDERVDALYLGYNCLVLS